MFAWWQSAAPQPNVPLATLALVALVGSASLTLWIRFAARAWEGQPPLAYEPRRPAPWKLIDLICLGLVYALASGLFITLYFSSFTALETEVSPELMPFVLIVDTARKLTALGAALVGFRIVRHATAEDWGLVSPRGSDLVIAFLAAVAILPPVYLLNGWLQSIEPTQHPLIRALAQSDATLLRVGTAISAGLFAPIWEELWFRSIFQGWLERVLLHRHEAPPEENAVAEIAPVAVDGAEYATVSSAPHGWWLPIVISSAVFAAAHLDFSAPRLDFIPIFFFALVLGYLYQRTHRILPSILLHMALNVSTLVMLFTAGPGELARP